MFESSEAEKPSKNETIKFYKIMKKYLFIIGVGAMLVSTSCDPQNEESLFADVDQAVVEDNAGDPNARIGRNNGLALQKLAYDYEVAEQAYYALMKNLSPGMGKAMIEESRTKEEFIEKMIIKSIGIFDEAVMENGHKMSILAKRKHEALAGGEHEVEYDVAAGALRSSAAYLKIGDIKGESTDREYKVAKIFELIGNGTSGSKGNPWNDSIPPVKAPEVGELGDFILGLSPRNIDPASLDGALNDLKINSGVETVLIGLLLPAVQKVREAAGRTNARGKADILIESLGVYGLNADDDLSSMYQVGALGSLGFLTGDEYDTADEFEDYDELGDVDWAALQLNRKKFEFEMFLLWERFWDNNHSDPTGGR